MKKKIEKFLSDNEDIYATPQNSQNTGDRFTDILKAAHEKTGHRAVVLIDEYDKLLLDVLDTRLSSMVDGEMFPCVLFHIQSLLFPFMA